MGSSTTCGQASSEDRYVKQRFGFPEGDPRHQGDQTILSGYSGNPLQELYFDLFFLFVGEERQIPRMERVCLIGSIKLGSGSGYRGLR